MKMNDEIQYPLMHIGIIGGGQLARMMITGTKLMGFDFTILEATDDAPASSLADHQIVGSLYDEAALTELVNRCDVTTYDIEHTDTVVLKSLEKEGHNIYPSPQLLEIIQDKLVQKQTLQNHHIPVPKFEKIDEPTPEIVQKFGLPLVQKARRGGYDGRGVQRIDNAADFGKIMPVPSMFEEVVDIEKELAVLVARSHSGEVRTYPVVEMVFDEAANILDYLVSPARISDEIAQKSCDIAIAAIEALDGVGIFAVELFLNKSGNILLNEIAPRPHNSGHFTIEACVTSQFQQHIRAICDLPLGSTEQHKPAVMINLLGDPGFSGTPLITGLRESLAIPGVFFHLYGKAETRPFRKMGHVTIIADTVEKALQNAFRVKEILHIKSKGK